MEYQPSVERYDRMQYKNCGNSGLLLPRISLGLWHNFGSVDDFGIASDMIKYAFDNGVTIVKVANDCASQVFIPFTIGGGIRTVEDMRKMLKAGADKVSMNTAAIKDPSIIKEGAEKFGNQCIVLAVDAKRNGENSWEVYKHLLDLK